MKKLITLYFIFTLIAFICLLGVIIYNYLNTGLFSLKIAFSAFTLFVCSVCQYSEIKTK